MTTFTHKVAKEDATGDVNLLFTNQGDELLQWAMGLAAAQEDSMTWDSSPMNGTLLSGEIGMTTLTVKSATLQSRPAPYITNFTMSSNSLRAATRSIECIVETYVSAKPSASFSSVSLDIGGDQVAASSTVRFSVEPFDATGMPMLDRPDWSLEARLLSNGTISGSTACRLVSYEGECELPALVTGAFELRVEDGDGALVGARAYSFSATECPEEYYRTPSGCDECPLDKVECAVGSDVSDWQLLAGYWRTSGESTKLYKCRHGTTSCPGNHNQTGEDPYCGVGFTGPLCSACKAHFFKSWSGDGQCYECDAKKSHHPTIWIGCGAMVGFAVLLAATIKKCQPGANRDRSAVSEADDDEAPPAATASLTHLIQRAAHLYRVGEIKMFTLLVMSQTISQFVYISKSTGTNSAVPEPAMSLVGLLSVANLDVRCHR